MERLAKIAALTMVAALSLSAAFAQEADVAGTQPAADAQPVAEAQPAADTHPVAEMPPVAATQETVAKLDAVPGVQTMFSQVFVDKSFKEIDIDLGSEDFVLIVAPSDRTTLEIKSNKHDFIPLVTQDEKSLKVVQKNKKVKTDGRICTVVLTVPQNFPPAEFELSMQSGVATLDPIAAGSVEIAVGNGTLTAKDIQASKEFELSVNAGKATLTSVEAGAAEIAAGNGTVTVERVRASKKLAVAANAGSLAIAHSETPSFSGAVKKGLLTAADVTAESIAVAVDSGKATVDLAKVFLRASSLLVGSGNLSLLLPADSVFYTTASVNKGQFESEFPSSNKGPELKVKISKGTATVTKR
ncbi:MAG: DUF4097 domain-containing protein [Treponemataceae bacterium]|nr:DUF4097 domain-containing protein [Treponemataceae bacterium]